MAARLFFIIERKVFHEQRSRADEAHIAFQHIDELGQFVERGLSDKFTYRGKAFCIREQLATGILFVVHGFELNQPERACIFARTDLGEKRIAGIGYREQNR